MNLKNLFFLIACLLAITSCELKEFSPDLNAERDDDLFGTWRFIETPIEDSSFYVFTDEGYVDATSYTNNAQLKGFTNLYQIWKNIEMIGDDGWGKLYKADSYSYWTMRRNENEEYYRLSESKDTLFLVYVNLKTKEANKEEPAIFIKNDFQLIYDGQIYVGIDTVSTD